MGRGCAIEAPDRISSARQRNACTGTELDRLSEEEEARLLGLLRKCTGL